MRKLGVILGLIVLAGGGGLLSGPVRWLAANVAAAVVLGVIGWLAFAYVCPWRTCWWCRNKPRGRRCWRCHGHRQVRRLGAYHVHKVKQSLVQAWQEREQ